MTVRQFFKSNAFKSLAVLIAIVLVAGGLLAIFNDLLYISDEERLNRTLSSIYGEPVTAETVTLDDADTETPYGTVNAAYYIVDDGNYLLQSTGIGGYSNGTVTLWTVLACSGSRENGDLTLTGIDKVVYESNQGQSWIANIQQSFYDNFAAHDELIADGGYFTAIKGSTDDLNNVQTGVSEASNAACNAVNAALYCFRAVFVSSSGGTETPPPEIMNEIFGSAVSIRPVAVREEDASNSYGSIDGAWYVPDENAYLFKTTGTGGYKDGTVTLWTALTCTGTPESGDLALTGIRKVVYDSNISQTLIEEIEPSFYDFFAEHDDLIADGDYFTAIKDGSDDLNNVTSGATKTSNAICNAVNSALCYFRTILTGGNA